MTQYNSAAIRQLATLLATAATVIFAVSVFMGGAFAIGLGVFAASEGGAVVGVGAGILVGVGCALVGWLIEVVLKSASQLMLAVVQIESNTRLSREVGSFDAVQPLTGPTKAYGLWLGSRSAEDLDSFLESMEASAPLLARSGVTAEDLRRTFPELAGSPDLETILGDMAHP